MKYEPCFHKANLTHPMSSHHPISIPLPPANALPRKDVRHGDGKSQPQINDANDSQVFAQLICILILCIYICHNIIYTIYIHMDVSLLGAARLCKWTTPSYTTKHFTGFYAHLCGSHPPWDPPLGIPDVSLKCQSQGGKLSVPASGGKYPMKFIWLGKSSNYCWIFYG